LWHEYKYKEIMKHHGFRAYLDPDSRKYEVIFTAPVKDVNFRAVILALKEEMEMA
jgi:hypothetical protein